MNEEIKRLQQFGKKHKRELTIIGVTAVATTIIVRGRTVPKIDIERLEVGESAVKVLRNMFAARNAGLESWMIRSPEGERLDVWFKALD